jgi:hypothetical protein
VIPVVYGAAAVAAIAAVLARAASPGELLGPVAAASLLAVVSAAISIVRRRRLVRALDAIKGAVPTVAKGLVEPPPPEVAELIGELRRLGFELLAATDTSIGAGQPIRTWVMTGAPGTTWVEIGFAVRPMAVFLSQSSVGRFLETTTRDGESIDDPRLLARALDTSAGDAYAAHRTTLEEWTVASGPGRVVLTLDDYLEAEIDQRRHTGGMRIRSFLDRVVEPGIRAWTLSAAIALAAVVALVILNAVIA